MDPVLSAALLIGAVVLLLALFAGSLWQAHSMGSASRDGELLVRTAERDSARTEAKALREASSNGQAASQGVVDAVARGADAPPGSDGDRVLWATGNPGGAGGGAPGEAGAGA